MGLPEVVGTEEQVHCSRRRLVWRGLEFPVCTINKSAHTKNNLETYLMILVQLCDIKSSLLFYSFESFSSADGLSLEFYYYYYYYYYRSFSRQRQLMVFHWSLSDSKSPQVSRTLLSMLAVRNNVVVWMVSTCPPISKSSSLFNNPLVTVPKTPITIGSNCHLHVPQFFSILWQSRDIYPSFHILSVLFCGQPGQESR